MFALSEDYQHAAVIADADKAANTFSLDKDRSPSLFSDLNRDGVSYVYISDFGPGASLSSTPATVFKPAAGR